MATAIINPYSVQASGGVDLTSGLTAAWDFDVDLNDDGPNGYHLSTTGSPAIGTYNGKTGLRTSDGNHAWINAASAPLLNEMTVFSVAFWCASVGTGSAGILNNAFAWATQLRWIIQAVQDGSSIYMQFRFRDPVLAQQQSPSTTSTFETTTWKHVILTVSETAKQARIYVNNTLEVDWDFTGYTMQTGSSWGFGVGGDGDGGGTSSELPVDISRVYVWGSKILSADERAAIYNGGADKKYADF